jgi:hypothetical protein
VPEQINASRLLGKPLPCRWLQRFDQAGSLVGTPDMFVLEVLF